MSVCPHCDELVLDTDRRERMGAPDGPQWWHWECAARGVIGSVAHVQQRCSCYVDGSECGDPPEMTRRQAAQAALAALRDRNRRMGLQTCGGGLDGSHMPPPVDE